MFPSFLEDEIMIEEIYLFNRISIQVHMYGSTFLTLPLRPNSFRVLVVVVCTLFCDLLLSNVSFDIHGCSIEPCGIGCMHSMDALLFWVCRRSHNREGWVLFFPLFDLRY